MLLRGFKRVAYLSAKVKNGGRGMKLGNVIKLALVLGVLASGMNQVEAGTSSYVYNAASEYSRQQNDADRASGKSHYDWYGLTSYDCGSRLGEGMYTFNDRMRLASVEDQLGEIECASDLNMEKVFTTAKDSSPLDNLLLKMYNLKCSSNEEEYKAHLPVLEALAKKCKRRSGGNAISRAMKYGMHDAVEILFMADESSTAGRAIKRRRAAAASAGAE